MKKALTCLSLTMGLFFGISAFIIVAILDGIALAIPIGIIAAVMSSLLLAAYLSVHNYIVNSNYVDYMIKNVRGGVLFEDSFFRLNGDAKNAGRLYLTYEMLTIVMLKRKKILVEIKIPLMSIIQIKEQNYYGHTPNILIIQKNGNETRFITDYKKLSEKLIPLIGEQVFFGEEPIDRRNLLEKKFAHLQKYLDQIEAPSETFQTFLSDYFIGHPMIRFRMEENQQVWDKFEGKEREIAIQMVLDNMGHHSAYIRAAGIFRDKRAIPMLEELVEKLPEKYCYEKLLAARVLYDWTRYERYLSVLAETLPNSGSFTKTSLDLWIAGLSKETAVHYIFMMLQDKDSFVRWCAYGTLLRYFHIIESFLDQKYAETKYYTDDKVYSDKALFEARLQELREKVEVL